MRSISLVPNAATTLLLSPWIPNYSFAGEAEQHVCYVGADYFPRHRRLLRATRRHAEDERALASQSAISPADSFLPAGEIRGPK